jgi:serine/threonine protein kinase
VVFTTAARDPSVAGGEHGTIILDFDLATDEDAVRGTCQEPWGTKGYLAPETLQFGEVSCKSDMWSAGALLAFQVGLPLLLILPRR